MENEGVMHFCNPAAALQHGVLANEFSVLPPVRAAR
jgi:hypothetical protein